MKETVTRNARVIVKVANFDEWEARELSNPDSYVSHQHRKRQKINAFLQKWNAFPEAIALAQSMIRTKGLDSNPSPQDWEKINQLEEQNPALQGISSELNDLISYDL